MKVANTKGGQLFSVCLTKAEATVIGSNFATMEIVGESNDRWLKIEAAKETDPKRCTIGPRSDVAHPFQLSRSAIGLPAFGTEQIRCTMLRDRGILYGSKPDMNTPVASKSQPRRPFKRGPKPSVQQANGVHAQPTMLPNTQGIGLDGIKAAVVLINELKQSRPKEVEIAVSEAGLLSVRFLIEFGG